MLRILILLSILFFSACSSFSKLSKYEKHWSLAHPVAALKAKKLHDTIYRYYDEVKLSGVLDKYESGGKLDAFRHIYAMALLSQKVKGKKIKKLGIAHEKGNYLDFLKHKTENGELPDSLSCVMDLRNNDVGIAIGLNNKSLNPQTLKELVLVLMKSGQGFYLKRNAAGQYVDCDNRIVDTQHRNGKWGMPKCLIPVNN